jgi:CheY-like chemotaxis protein
VKYVLVVDDEPVVRSLVEASLESADCRVLGAKDGPSALAAVSRRRPDLILLDLGLPGMEGAEVARRLKTDRATAGVPIIYLTGRQAPSSPEAEGVIRKPFTPAVLRSHAANWL